MLLLPLNRWRAHWCVDWRDACDQLSVWRGTKCTLLPGRPVPAAILQQRRIRKLKIANHDWPPQLLSTLSQLFEGVSEMQYLKLIDCGEWINSVLLETLSPSGLPLVTKLVFRNNTYLNDISVELITRLMPNLHLLDLNLCWDLTDTALLYITARLRRLQHLNLARVHDITPKGIGYLAGIIDKRDTSALALLQQLKGTVGHADSNDNLSNSHGRHHLTRLSLVSLCLFSCGGITDEALRHLSSLTEIRSLDLTFCNDITSEGLAHLPALPNLTWLQMSYCFYVSTSGLAHLAGMSSLLELNLRGCLDIQTDGIKTLARGKSKLTSLDTSCCGLLTSETLDHIANGLLHLRRLRIDRCQTTVSSLATVRQKLPLLTDLQITVPGADFPAHCLDAPLQRWVFEEAGGV